MLAVNGDNYSFDIKPPNLSPDKWFKYWGVDDWREENKYPKGNEALLFDEWRWEFLRRDPSYREDYTCCRLSDSDRNKVPISRYFEYGLTELINPALSYSNLPERFFFERYPIIVRSEYGTYNPNFPDIETSDDYIFLLDEERACTINVRLDLRRPLVPQRENIKKIFEEAQRKYDTIKRLRGSDDLAECLRALDAHQAGVSNEEIGNELFSRFKDKHSRSARVCQTIELARDLWRRL